MISIHQNRFHYRQRTYFNFEISINFTLHQMYHLQNLNYE